MMDFLPTLNTSSLRMSDGIGYQSITVTYINLFLIFVGIFVCVCLAHRTLEMYEILLLVAAGLPILLGVFCIGSVSGWW